VDLSRKGDLLVQKEPELAGKPEPKPAPAEAVQLRQVPAPATQIDPAFDDDQLEIPAFLRRQAN